MPPEFSIIMSVFNGEKFIAQAIESVLNQTFTDFEFIIINDGSTDSTEGLVQANSDRRIKNFTLPHMGLAKALNSGLAKSTGRLISRIDADDWWEPNKLEKQLNFLNANPSYFFVSSGRICINVEGKKFVECEPDHDLDYTKLKDKLGCFNVICHSSVVFKREILTSTGYYAETIPYCEDYEYWVRILFTNKGYSLGQALVHYRIHPNMLSIKKSRQQSLNIIRVKFKLFSLYGFKIKYLRFLVLDIARFIFPAFFSNYTRLSRK